MQNKLSGSHSQYLQQHADQPVDWWPWSTAALDFARAQDKLIVVSIGYASCHWCHVMAQECFEDQEVAALMNASFVAIKVDRAERPDLDHYYMSALLLMNGSGGWPLNCILLPDGQPIFGGTYFSKTNWMRILHQTLDIWKKRKTDAVAFAKRLHEGIVASEGLIANDNEATTFDGAFFDGVIAKLKTKLDFEKGGINRVPKFPMLPLYQFLLAYSIEHPQDTTLQKQVYLTSWALCNKGLFDHLEGGLARYSTDEDWKVPHFEKMLYDNAQFLSYLGSHSKADETPYVQDTIEKSMAFSKEWLLGSDGLFFAAVDADSDHEEGAYYTWAEGDFERLSAAQGNGFDFEFVKDLFAIKPDLQWEGRFILQKLRSTADLAKQYGLNAKEIAGKISTQEAILKKERWLRTKPMVDTLVVTAWNGLMIKGLCICAKALEDERQFSLAMDAQKFAVEAAEMLLLKRFDSRSGALKRTNGDVNNTGCLDDYAYLMEGLVELAMLTNDPKWLSKAAELMKATWTTFDLNANGLFYFATQDKTMGQLPVVESRDSEVPSSNASLCRSLLILGNYFAETKWIAQAKKMLEQMTPAMKQDPEGHGYWLLVALQHSKPFYILKIAEGALPAYKEVTKAFKHLILLVEKQSAPSIGEQDALLCQEGTCYPPFESPAALNFFLLNHG